MAVQEITWRTLRSISSILLRIKVTLVQCVSLPFGLIRHACLEVN